MCLNYYRFSTCSHSACGMRKDARNTESPKPCTEDFHLARSATTKILNTHVDASLLALPLRIEVMAIYITNRTNSLISMFPPWWAGSGLVLPCCAQRYPLSSNLMASQSFSHLKVLDFPSQWPRCAELAWMHQLTFRPAHRFKKWSPSLGLIVSLVSWLPIQLSRCCLSPGRDLSKPSSYLKAPDSRSSIPWRPTAAKNPTTPPFRL